MKRDDNVQQQIEQEMEQAFLEEMKARVQEEIETVKQEINTIRAKDFDDFVQSHEKDA